MPGGNQAPNGFHLNRGAKEWGSTKGESGYRD